MVFTLIFLLLNMVDGLVLSSMGYEVTTWQYWVSTCCVCGAYMMGCFKYIFKDGR